MLLLSQQQKTRKIIRELIDKTAYFQLKEITSAEDINKHSDISLTFNPVAVVFDINFDGIDPVAFIDRICGKNKLCCPLVILSESPYGERVVSAINVKKAFLVDKALLRFNLTALLKIIEQHERNKEMLITKEAELKSILETQNEMICRFRPDTTLTYVNKAYAATFGKNPKELLGMKFLELIPSGEHSAIVKFLASVNVNNPKAIYRHSVQLPDGSIGWQEWTDSALFDDKDNITGFQSVGRDITREVMLSQALEKTEEKERRLIARDLHDHIGQMLTYIKLRIERGMMFPQENDTHQLCGEILGLITDCMQELRKVSRRITAGFVKDEPLSDTLVNLMESFEYIAKVKVNLNVLSVPNNLTQEAKSHIYRLVQEAFTNILKHAEATEVSIDFKSSNGFLSLSILDNGIGADIDSHAIKNGFMTMRHRVEVLQGEISFSSEPGSFFMIHVNLPENNTFLKDHAN